MLCIWYPVQFQKDQPKFKVLINFGREVNTITLAYTTKLGFIIWKTSVGAPKIKGLLLETYDIVSVSFLLQDSLGRIWFFDEIFLLIVICIEVVLRMPLLSFSNVNIEFVELKKLT